MLGFVNVFQMLSLKVPQ